MALSLNPAGLVDGGRQFQMGASLFAPFRSFSGTGTQFNPTGTFDSDSNYFIVPNMAYSSPIDACESVRNPVPRNIVIWRGLSRLTDIEIGAEIGAIGNVGN